MYLRAGCPICFGKGHGGGCCLSARSTLDPEIQVLNKYLKRDRYRVKLC